MSAVRAAVVRAWRRRPGLDVGRLESQPGWQVLLRHNGLGPGGRADAIASVYVWRTPDRRQLIVTLWRWRRG